jgi:hypothetical protein
MLLHVTGTPATGKSTFTRWLETTHGYTRWPQGDEPGPTSTLGEIQHAIANSPNVVLDWNVPPAGIPQVQMVHQWGFETWWFDGDRDTGLQVFLARPNHPATIRDYQVYMAGIERYWAQYHSLFHDRRLDVLRPGPIFMPNEARWAKIETYPRLTSERARQVSGQDTE